MPSDHRPDHAADRVVDLRTRRAGAEAGTEEFGAIEQVIDLRQPGAPYTYPSNPSASGDDRYESDPNATTTGQRSVAHGSAEVRSAPPGHTD